MWLIPLAVVALLVLAGRDRAPARVGYAAPRHVQHHRVWPVRRSHLPSCDGAYYADYYAPPPYAYGPPPPPSPLVVLADLASAGREIPPFVIMCAIAEAEARGRLDVANDIVRVFVEPVVHQRQAEVQAWRLREHFLRNRPRAIAPVPAASAEDVMEPSTFSDAEMRQMIDEAPEKFVALLEQERDGTRGPAPEPLPSNSHLATQRVMPLVGREIPDLATQRRAPIEGVDLARWDDLCGRLAREAPTFESSRHVGQYRHRRERLAELGFDPAAVAASPDAQRAALDRDLADACAHLAESGIASEHVGRPIQLPGEEGPRTITLSGLLGLAQVAGLEGAARWLENREDRKRYPHTTAAFARTNGVF